MQGLGHLQTSQLGAVLESTVGRIERYVLRAPIARERLEQRPEGLVRITLKKAYTDGTVSGRSSLRARR